MTIQSIRYFVEIVHEKSFSKAAKALYVTEATISHQINKLEQEIGFKLFERTNRNVEVTKAGQTIYPKAIQVLEAFNNMENSIDKINRKMANTISIGMVPVMNSIGLVDHISEFSKELIHIETKIQITTEDDLCSQLRNNEIDFAIVKLCDDAFDYFDQNIFSYIPIKKECVNVLMGTSIAPKQTQSLNLKELSNYPLVLDKEDSYFYYIANKHYLKNSLPLNVYPLETNDLATIMMLIESNKGICYASTSAAKFYKKLYHIKSFPITPRINQYISILYLKTKQFTKEQAALIDYLKNVL